MELKKGRVAHCTVRFEPKRKLISILNSKTPVVERARKRLRNKGKMGKHKYVKVRVFN